MSLDTPDHDLFAIAGMTYDEDAYTNLMAWSLRPSTDPASALPRQRAWLSSLPVPEADGLDATAEPVPRLYTDDGFPDLVLRYRRFVVVVEAKTGTGEHPAPSGLPQSVAYPLAVRRKFALHPAVPVYLIYLTPWPEASPANPEAVVTTYRDFALALAARLDPADLSDEVRPLLRLFLTHLLLRTDPGGVTLYEAVDRLVPLLADPPAGAEGQLIANLGAVNLLLDLFGRAGYD